MRLSITCFSIAHKTTVDLPANNCPRNFIRQQEQRSQHTQATRSTEPVRGCIPYVEGLTQAIRRILSSVSIRTVSRSNSLKWTLMKGRRTNCQDRRRPGLYTRWDAWIARWFILERLIERPRNESRSTEVTCFRAPAIHGVPCQIHAGHRCRP